MELELGNGIQSNGVVVAGANRGLGQINIVSITNTKSGQKAGKNGVFGQMKQ